MNIPLFPLGTVLFPGGALPLQIFEVRYLDMVQRCHRDGTPFGVVCLTQGSEVQQRDPSGQSEGFVREGFLPVGTLAHIVALQSLQAGLLRITCEGSERFRIKRSEKLKHGLWVADVVSLPVDPVVPIPDELQGIADALQRLHERLMADQADVPPLPSRPAPGTSALEDSPWLQAGWVANRWAELLPLSPSTKHNLLTLDNPLLRLELVGDALEQLGIAG